MRRKSRWALVFILLYLPDGTAKTAGKSCALKAQELKLAHECFSGDMSSKDDLGYFLGSDENKNDLNYCFNAFVIVHPPKGAQQDFTVLKDGPKGQLHVYNYSTLTQALLPHKASARVPTSKSSTAVTFKNLTAECFSKSDKCSKGVLGFGSSDLPLTVELLPAGRSGFKVKGATKDPSVIQNAAAPGRLLEPKSESDVHETDNWLTKVVKQRIMQTAQRELASIKTHKLSGKSVASGTSQLRYCRMAFEGFVHQKKMADPFTEQERRVLDSLEDQLKNANPVVK